MTMNRDLAVEFALHGSVPSHSRTYDLELEGASTLLPPMPPRPGTVNTTPIYGRTSLAEPVPSYTVASGNYLYMSASTGAGSLFPWGLKTLTNAGTIYLEDAAGASGDLTIAPWEYPVKNLVNSGTIVVHLRGTVGDIVAFEDEATDGVSGSVQNSGTVYLANDHSDAYFYVSFQSHASVVNSGLIGVYAPEGVAIAVQLAAGAVTNQAGGEILVDGDGTIGILVDAPAAASGAVEVTNAGLIEARATGNFSSVGVLVEQGDVVNTGTITGDYSVYVDGTLQNSGVLNGIVYADEALTFDNQASGVLYGDFIGGESTGALFDKVTNAGLIDGNVELWGGNDTFTNIGSGFVSGFIDLGVGNDRFEGNSTSELVYGGDGNDTLNGNSGEHVLEGELATTRLTAEQGSTPLHILSPAPA